MASFLLINLFSIRILLVGFGLLSLTRRRFEAKQLAINAIITLIAYWLFAIVLLFMVFSTCATGAC